MKISQNNWLEIYITPPIYNYIICLFECYTNVIRVIFRKKMSFLLLILKSSFNFVIFDGNFCDTKGNRFGFSFSKAVNMK